MTWNWRPDITSSYGSRTDTIFLMTQDLDFLMTQDDNYIVLQDSYSNYTDYSIRDVIASTWAPRT